MITYIQPQGWKGHVLTNTDRVIAGIAVPRGGVFHGYNGLVQVRGLEQLVLKEGMYALSMYSVPVLNPATSQDFENVWDKTIPKNVAESAGALDLDTATTDGSPEYEPGGVNWAGVYDMESGPKRLYRKRKVMSAVENGAGIGATGAFTHYIPKDTIQVSVAGGFRATVPSVVMLALSNPVIGGTTTVVPGLPTEKEWYMLQMLERTAENALEFLIGMHIGGTQEGNEEAAVFLDKTLAPQWYEETGAEFTAQTWEVTAHSKWTMSVPGRMKVSTLDGDK